MEVEMRPLPVATFRAVCLPPNRSRLASLLTVSLLCGVNVMCGGGAVTSPPEPALPAPKDLAYPQPTITATVGQAITPDMPTFSGTVSSFTVNPALPSGFTLDGSSGEVSGTPTISEGLTTYTVKASNSSGATTTTLQITVNAAVSPPTKLAYVQTTVSATVGQEITPLIPTVTGTVSSFTVSPALPPGLNVDSSTGILSRTPTAAAAGAIYTISAANSGGRATDALAIAVNKAPITLIDLGRDSIIQRLRVQSSRLLSEDANGHWVLWDYVSGSSLAEGDDSGQLLFLPVDMSGPTFVISLVNGLEVRSSSDGHLLSIISVPGLNSSAGKSWWQLASDRSYVCAGSQTGLFVWNPSGQLLLSESGDYSSAKTFSAPTELRIALGPAGPNIIQTISIPNGNTSVSQPFSGQFNSWFLDGERFFANTSTTVWVYDKSAAQQAPFSLPTVENLGGEGNYFWTYAVNDAPFALSIYDVGSSVAVATYNLSVDTSVIPSGTSIAILPVGTGAASIIDLSGSVPSKTDYTFPVAYLSSYAAASTTNWVVGNNHGVLVDGASSMAAAVRYFGFGAAWSIAGATSRVAVSTANGSISYFDTASQASEGTISFSSGKLVLSSDGTVLAASANASDAQYEPDRTLNIYSLPSGALTKSFPYVFQDGVPDLMDFSLSGSGDILGQITGTFNGSWTYVRQVSSISSGTTIWSDTGADRNLPIQLSPDGTLIAVSNGSVGQSTGTNIFQNGTLATAVPGFGIGWI